MVESPPPTPFRSPCTPPIPANPAAPTLSGVSVTPAAGNAQVGDSLMVHFTAHAVAGLWQSIVELSGACDTVLFVPEGLAPSATHSVLVTVPQGCRPGGGLTITVFAVDAAVQNTQGSPGSALTFVDNRAPQIGLGFFPVGRNITTVVSGDFFWGDVLNLQLYADDDNNLGWLRWGVVGQALKDSAAVHGPGATVDFTMVAQSGWGPMPQLQFTAEDQAGNVSTLETVTDSIRVYPEVVRPVTEKSFGLGALNALVDGRRQEAWIVQDGYQGLVSFPFGSGAPLSALPLPDHALYMDLTASGDSLLFTLPSLRQVGAVDLQATPRIVTVAPLTLLDSLPGLTPGPVMTTANGKALIVLQGATFDQNRLLELDLATGRERLRLDAGLAGAVAGLPARSPDHGTVLLNDPGGRVQVYSVVTDQFGPLVDVGSPYGVFSVANGGDVISYGLRIFDQSLQAVRSVTSTRGALSGVVSFLTRDGQYLYYNAGGLVRARVGDSTLVDRFQTPFTPSMLSLSDDGNWAVGIGIAGLTDSPVAIVDLRDPAASRAAGSVSDARRTRARTPRRRHQP